MTERRRLLDLTAIRGRAAGLIFFDQKGQKKDITLIQKKTDGFYVDGNIKEGPSGPYDEIIDFGTPPHIVGEIEPVKRFTCGRSSRLIITAVEEPAIRDAMRNISEIVNNPEFSVDNPEHRFLYQSVIMPVFERGMVELNSELKRQGNLENNNYAIYAPLRGGEFTTAALLYNANKNDWKIPPERIACIEEKRVLMHDGKLFIGVRKGYCPPSDATTTTVICDDCVSSVRSVVSTIQVANEVSLGELGKKKLSKCTDSELAIHYERNRKYPAVVMVAAASEYGIIDAPDTSKMITGEVVYGINDSLYLMRTPQENFPSGSFYVGDMGSWLGRLPDSFDKKAPWNKVRRQLVSYWKDTNKLPATLKSNGYSNWGI